jgi:hypothetical protein
MNRRSQIARNTSNAGTTLTQPRTDTPSVPTQWYVWAEDSHSSSSIAPGFRVEWAMTGILYATSLDGIADYQDDDYPGLTSIVTPYDGIYSFTIHVEGFAYDNSHPAPTTGYLEFAMYNVDWFWHVIPFSWMDEGHWLNYTITVPLKAGTVIHEGYVVNRTDGWYRYGAWEVEVMMSYLGGPGESWPRYDDEYDFDGAFPGPDPDLILPSTVSQSARPLRKQRSGDRVVKRAP